MCLLNSLIKLYYSYIYLNLKYLNYPNMAWGCTHRTIIHKIHLKQKHAIRLIRNENKFTHTKSSM